MPALLMRAGPAGAAKHAPHNHTRYTNDQTLEIARPVPGCSTSCPSGCRPILRISIQIPHNDPLRLEFGDTGLRYTIAPGQLAQAGPAAAAALPNPCP